MERHIYAFIPVVGLMFYSAVHYIQMSQFHIQHELIYAHKRKRKEQKKISIHRHITREYQLIPSIVLRKGHKWHREEHHMTLTTYMAFIESALLHNTRKSLFLPSRWQEGEKIKRIGNVNMWIRKDVQPLLAHPPTQLRRAPERLQLHHWLYS